MTGRDRGSPDNVPRDPRTTDRRKDDRSAATDLSRRTLLCAVAGVGIAGTSGCLTLDPTVKMSDLSKSALFEGVSVSGPWASGRVTASVSLEPTATTKLDV